MCGRYSFQRSIKLLLGTIILLLIASCKEKIIEQPFPADTNLWKSIRKERIQKLLPDAMKLAGVDAWIIICRENNNDPLAKFVGGENAGGTAAFLFFRNDEGVRSVAISPMGEATSLKEVNLHDEVVVIERGSPIGGKILDIVSKYDPEKIAINTSDYGIADGLSYTQKEYLSEALGSKYKHRLVSSFDLVMEWLSVKLPDEIKLMKRAAEITAQIEVDAYKMVIPGKTKDSDVAKYIKGRMSEINVSDAWAPDQNPSVNSGPDRGHSHSTEKVIQPGDIIQLDFGIMIYDTWCSDIQRFAYVLKPGETEPPKEIKKYFEFAKEGHRKVLEAMKPGVTGWAIDKIQREWMEKNGSMSVMWGTGHPVGYWAHDAGPSLGGAAYSDKPVGNSARLLREGQTFAYDGFYKWVREDGTEKTISVEEMAVVTETGAEYMSKPQEEWILIKSN
ncbi:MAG: aminopeptidase P family protein [Bacteroidetes bacterium]|nr:aminopeptidase P family protein [Bacteroidota bacterium]